MKILIVNTSDIDGGAARAAYRLHKTLLDEGLDSQMIVQNKLSDDFTIIGPPTKMQKVIAKFRPILDNLVIRFYRKRRLALFSAGFSPFSSIVQCINEINPDVVHLHWISAGMIQLEDLSKIKAPIVWSLHDMWAFTGGCHYDSGCGRYVFKCGRCPVLGSDNEKDLSRIIWLRKNKIIPKVKNLTIVGLSRWLSNCAKESSLFKNTNVITLPNPINVDIFSPFSKSQARQLFNLPLDRKLILFGALGAFSDPRKGFKELLDALLLTHSVDTELVIFGSSQPEIPQGFSQKTHYLGRIHDDVSLRLLYSAGDVMIVPSLQENLSNAIMESLSCGTPVVCFDIGGNSDLIDHKWNGYLAKPYSVLDLSEGIEWVLNQSENTELYKNARQKVLNEFDSRIVIKKYIDMYKKVSQA